MQSFFKFFTGYRSKPKYTTNCQLSVTTSLIRFAACLSELLIAYTPSRQLRSSADTRTLHIPQVTAMIFGQSSLSYSVQKQRNCLSSDIRHIHFSHALKTAFFLLSPHPYPSRARVPACVCVCARCIMCIYYCCGFMHTFLLLL